MEDRILGNGFLVYMMLIFSIILVFFQIIDMVNIINSWSEILISSINSSKYWEIITQTVFTVFSLFTGLSSLILIGFLVTKFDFFVKKLLSTYLYLNYWVLGPFMLGLSSLGLFYWDNVIYCYDPVSKNVYISINNLLGVVLATIFSFVITISISGLNTFSNFQSIVSYKVPLIKTLLEVHKIYF